MIQRLMNHRPLGSQHRALEILSRLSFPSLPDKSVAGLVAEALSMFTGVKEDEDFSSYSCSFLSDLWATCLSDSFVGHLLYSFPHFSTALIHHSTPLYM